jgi:uncharacterized membrane protein
MNQVKVTTKRHLAKTISYRIISTLIGFLLMWGMTGKIEIGVAFGVIELLYKPIQYYIHERVWYRFIKFGLVDIPPIKEIKLKKKKPFKKIPPPPQQEPRVIKENEQPLKPEIKRLTYTKKSDN